MASSLPSPVRDDVEGVTNFLYEKAGLVFLKYNDSKLKSNQGGTMGSVRDVQQAESRVREAVAAHKTAIKNAEKIVQERSSDLRSVGSRCKETIRTAEKSLRQAEKSKYQIDRKEDGISRKSGNSAPRVIFEYHVVCGSGGWIRNNSISQRKR